MDWTWLYVIVGTGASALLNFLVLYFWKPWAQAYAGEKAKNVARKEDLDKILLEVRAVTAATESIKADINGGLWERQMCWNQNAASLCRIDEKDSRVTELQHESTRCHRRLKGIIWGTGPCGAGQADLPFPGGDVIHICEHTVHECLAGVFPRL